jgi:hypothetical protein
MTTNVPQDVIDDFKEAGFPVELMFDWENRVAKFLQLRAQRQQGAEPVAYQYRVYYKEEIDPGWGLWNECKKDTYGSILESIANGNCSIQVRELYTTPPQANNATEHPCDLLVATAYRKAAEICDKQAELDRAAHEAPAGSITRGSPYHEGAADAADECMFKILAAIPADAEAALREVCMKVAEAVDNKWQDAHRAPKSLEAIVNSVLGEGGK